MGVNTIPNTQGNKVLWSGASYMGGGLTATLSEPISKQRTGIVLVWSAYGNGQAQNYDFAYHFVPKEKISGLSEVGANFPLGTANFSKFGCKYLYFQDSVIRGYSTNDTTGSGSGITYTNNYWVLRQVLGV